ncbi:MAG: DUF4235 domain-containing protein [Actinobacteria bacterium]|nr:DUF4235 domain-containing protein [Actinomycetota bacterium]MCB8996191.1 DUF4235 domain-containing protein [Actinomycetota bacterium]MCB9413930.1 DUF4235 domain-containing protein [Actinomycetota bacterium]HRY09614.1 DUF4235 domain-containing protein [Candidatus Nanopelagicales bacterium]
MNPRLLTPLVSVGAAWATKKSLNAMYARRHDGTIPSKDDVDVPFARVLIWALATAVVVALVDVAVQQGMARLAERPHGELEA